jgi:hypothetical protein
MGIEMGDDKETIQQLLIEERAAHKTSVLQTTLLVGNSAALLFCVSAIFYFGEWKGGVDQQLESIQAFVKAGDRYPLSRGTAIEARLSRQEQAHDNDIKELRSEWISELRDLRLLIERKTGK